MNHTQPYFERGMAWAKNAGSWASEHRYLLGGLLGGQCLARLLSGLQALLTPAPLS